jgi:origin recognition complex subunit 3
MCHYYANPLSVLLSDVSDGILQSEHLELVRALPSFRNHVESILEAESGDVKHVRKLLDDDDYLTSYLGDCRSKSRQWVLDMLRRSMILTAGGCLTDFVQLYLDILENGIDVADNRKAFIELVQRMPPSELTEFLTRVLDIIEHGDESLGLDGWADEAKDTLTILSELLTEVKDLQEKAEDNDTALKSRYSSHGKVLRTTVIAQKVQLSQDTADLTDEDKAFTKVIDRLVEHLESILEASRAEDITFHETWLYDSKTPYRNVFIPRPRGIVERALMRPHDYLSCSCCKSGNDEIKSTLPATAILYRLYLETGALINVADLWSAYYAVVGEEQEDGLDERTALVMFYRGLSELKAMGFVKQSRKKEDHIAKLAWQGL